MGWSFGYNGYKEMSAYILQEWEGNRYIAHKKHGNVLWGVVEKPNGERWIACHLVECKKGEWGYKSMEEAAHPFYYSCPLSFLEMTPLVECQEWRDKVVEYWNQIESAKEREKNFVRGTKIRLPQNYKVREFVLAVKRGRTWTGYAENGKLYRLPLSVIKLAEVTGHEIL